jgi:glycosyltransferase involved in cell wall biosynthesis
MVALVPVYNHQGQVGAVVRGLKALGATVIAVDDGSSDGSGEAAAEAGAEVHRLPENRGKGEALRAGLALASERGYAQALSCDADGQHPPEAALTLARAATDAAALHVGRREMAGAPRASRFGRWWSNLWVWICCGWWVGDSQSGLRVYPLPSTTKLPVRAGHYAWEVEVLVRAAWAGLPIRYASVPVIYPKDRVSHFHAFKDNLRTSLAFHLLVWRRMIPWPHRRLVPRKKLRFREVLTANLSPWQVASACALGAAIGVAPIPGLQMIACVWLSWMLRLNLPLALLISNHSFGPMLAAWYALAAAIGLSLLTGVPLMEALPKLHQQLRDAHGPAAEWEVVRQSLGAWLLGCTLLMAVLGVVAGFTGYLIAELVHARRRRRSG